jgi:cysteine synthase A
VRLNRLPAEHGAKAEILAKLEFFNPMSSVKDRIGVSMIDAAEKAGKIKPGVSTIIEPTSGNTGIGLAFVAAARGYKAVFTMPDSMSIERRKMLFWRPARAHAAREGDQRRDLPRRGAAQGDSQQLHAAAVPECGQPGGACAHHGRGDPEGHRRQDRFFRVGRRHRRHHHRRGPGAEAEGAAGQDGRGRAGVESSLSGTHSPHPIQGISAGIIPDILDRTVIDEIVKVANDAAIKTAKAMSIQEGIPIGISGGAAVWAALTVGARPENAGKRVVVIVPDFAERYLSTVLFEGLD